MDKHCTSHGRIGGREIIVYLQEEKAITFYWEWDKLFSLLEG